MQAFLAQPGGTPALSDWDPPTAEPALAPVRAAALNPVDLAIGAGGFPFRPLSAGDVLGFEGVAQTGPDTHVYFSAPAPPFGSFAERVDLSGAETVELPAGVDPVAGAALGVPGIAAFLALTKAGRMQAGERVLVLGGTGSVGRLTVQLARALGAAEVAATTRGAGSAIEAAGGRPVRAATAGELSAGLARLEPFDVVVDTLWGDYAGAAVEHTARYGRFAQVGNSAGARGEIAAPDFRNRGISFIGHSNFLAASAERTAAYAEVAALLAAGELEVRPDVRPLAELPQAWADAAAGRGGGKLVVCP